MAMIVWRLDVQLPMQPVPITTDVARLNLDQGARYTTLCDLKFVSDLGQVDGFLLVLLVPPPIKLTATI